MKINLKIAVIGFVFIGVLVLGLSGCHTAEGFGRDLEESGQAIQKSASKDDNASTSKTTTTTSSKTTY